MSCIWILGCKLTPDDLPESLYKLLFENENLKAYSENVNLKIYTIKYNNVDLDFYINACEDYIYDSIYLIYNVVNSNKDKDNYFDNMIPIDSRVMSHFYNWLENLKHIDLNCYNIGFFIRRMN